MLDAMASYFVETCLDLLGYKQVGIILIARSDVHKCSKKDYSFPLETVWPLQMEQFTALVEL